jgi:two-component sensor histidine kinase
VVQSIARQTAPNSQDVSDYVARLAARVQALAQTHDLIADEDWQGVTLDDLATRHLAPFVDEEWKRARCDGPQLVLSPVAQNIGLALHELATNAVKHGALSVSEGKIDLVWHLAPPLLHITWREREGPPVTVPSRKGFGYVVLARLTPEALDGQATLAFLPEGLSWKLDMPATYVL